MSEVRSLPFGKDVEVGAGPEDLVIAIGVDIMLAIRLVLCKEILR